MTILVIDDVRKFRFDAQYERTSKDGLLSLAIWESFGLDELWLDHDLGIGGGTIMPVVNWLTERAHNGHPYPVKKIFVHTANPYAAKIMTQTLERYGYDVTRVAAWDYEIYE